MKKNFRIHTAALGVLLSATLVTNCSLFSGAATTDDDVLTLTALQGALGLLAGNCVQLTRTGAGTTASPHSYTAQGTIIPRGGCNEATLVGTLTTDVEAAKTAATETYSALKAQLPVTTATAPCATTFTVLGTNLPTGNTTAAIQGKADAQSTVGAGQNELCTNADAASGAGLSGTTYCRTADDIARFRDRRQYLVVSNVQVDMGQSFSTLRLAAENDANLTDAAAAQLRLMSTTELTLIKGNHTKVIGVATSAGVNEAGCAAAMVRTAGNESYKAVLTQMVTNTTFNTSLGNMYAAKVAALGVTAAEVAAVTIPITPGLYCSWTFNPVSKIRSAGSPDCPASYPSF